MPDFEYDRARSSGGGWPRLLLLTLIAGAVTLGVIWCIIPAKKDPEPAAKSGEAAPAATPEAVPAAAPETPSAAVPEPGPASAATTSSTSASAPAAVAETASSPAATPEPAAAQDVPVKAASGPETAAAPQTALPKPQKDRPWAGDPVLDEAKVAASGIYSRAWRDEAARLTAASREALKSGKAPVVVHKTVSGDNLSKLAARYAATVDGIKHLNRLKKDSIMVGQRLKVCPGPWKVEISKSARVLTVYRVSAGKSELFAAFDIGVGRQGKTPVGDFVICTRLRHPDWYAPDGGRYRYGEKGNVLGDYFLKLGTPGRIGKSIGGYGIHGTGDEANVTRSRSGGCIRMRNSDVELLYRLLPVNTPVKIIE